MFFRALLLTTGFLSCALEVSLIFIGWSIQPSLAYIFTFTQSGQGSELLEELLLSHNAHPLCVTG
nr:MAG TPA: hypothetical protein [Caudoviricetes sp.]